MIFVPLLSVLIGALCPAAEGRPLPNVNDTQQHYQAVEHSNVTLTVSIPVNSTSDLLFIDLMRMETWRRIYRNETNSHRGLYIDGQFKGRLQCDLHLVRNGCIECLLSDVRLSDEGWYRWIVATTGRRNLTKLELVVRVRKHDQVTIPVNVEAEAVMPQTQEEPPKPTERKRIGMYMSFGLLAVVIVCHFLQTITFCNFTRLNSRL
ncbi:uncharacterized protein LOC103480820 [Poecilia reticulata]|uniref:uncharacterized protein LOC103480820 n=1 Tax=Poecilia reticulata TaxID=8081 RepID=UPI0004A4A600|nr:PREDICTED: uncharacterized protein LOC103480820 [Poecilia reticulata]